MTDTERIIRRASAKIDSLNAQVELLERTIVDQSTLITQLHAERDQARSLLRSGIERTLYWGRRAMQAERQAAEQTEALEALTHRGAVGG